MTISQIAGKRWTLHRAISKLVELTFGDDLARNILASVLQSYIIHMSLIIIVKREYCAQFLKS